ncbi:MAG TPA: hypothetical protein VFQ51_05480 [Vicinamibacteria bacterium]|nr:hypothetical protein [Vicinamibacteria bacterium]
MNDWFARARPGGGAAVGLTSVALLVVAALGACTHTQGTDGTPAAAAPVGPAAALDPYPLIPLRKDLGEFLIEGEKAYVQQAIASVEKVIKFRLTDADIQSTRIGAGNRRGDHSTPHGCFPAEFTVQPQNPQGKAAGGIADRRNHGTTFPAIVRFSNSETTDVQDLRSASIGLALKIDLQRAGYSQADFLPGTQPPGVKEQDFLTGTNRTFLAPDIKDYSWLFEKRVDPGITDIAQMILTHPKVFYNRTIAPKFRGKSAAPLLLQKEFFGILPYAWDTRAVKFKFVPCHAFDPEKFPFDHKDPRYQMKMIAQFLAGADACYRMRVQVRPDQLPDPHATPLEKLFPIEDATVYWPDGDDPAEVQTSGGAVRVSSDFEDVGAIRIKQGTAPLADQACEGLAYNPWHGLKAHQPLGSLSRARLVVYHQSERVRREIYREQATGAAAGAATGTPRTQ